MIVSIFQDLTYVVGIDYSPKPGSPMIPGQKAIDAQPEVKDPDTGEIISPEVLAQEEIPTVPEVLPSGHEDCIGCFDIEDFVDPHSQALKIKRKGKEISYEVVQAEERKIEIPVLE